MKNKIILVLAFLFTMGGLTHAQQYETEFELIQSIIGKTKKDFVSEFLEIPTEKSDRFWNLYNEYEAKRKDLGRQRLELIGTYANNYSETDGEMHRQDIKKMINKAYTLTNKYERLRKKYYTKIYDHVNPQTALQFMVVESYLETTVESNIYENLPF